VPLGLGVNQLDHHPDGIAIALDTSLQYPTDPKFPTNLPDRLLGVLVPEDACATEQRKLASSLGTRFRTAASKTSTPRDAQDLFRCRGARAHLAKPILPQRPHTSGYGPTSQFSRAAPPRKLRAELLVEQE
jgi:hypothetical protein